MLGQTTFGIQTIVVTTSRIQMFGKMASEFMFEMMTFGIQMFRVMAVEIQIFGKMKEGIQIF